MVKDLENKIKRLIIIPTVLYNNMSISTTGLGGVCLSYRSNSYNTFTCEQSQVKVTLIFNTKNGLGNYAGDYVSLVCIECSGLKGLGVRAPRGNNNKMHYIQVVEKVNKWFKDNEALLYSAIENK